MQDVAIMTEHWGENDPLCDIGPMPWGDGIVDVQDLIVLTRYMEAIKDPTLIAHWALDETEGLVAHDRVGANDGTVMGVPAWQPSGGQVNGALEFDGTTFIAADHVLSPSDGPFSVLAWLKGGEPGQAIISQPPGAEWLMADAMDGALMTGLQGGGRLGKALCSDAVITDGNWHRVGFTWDGSYRRLYVDDVLVAEDTQTGLAECCGGLNIGCAANMTPGTFFAGLIDDVRIYNRAVEP